MALPYSAGKSSNTTLHRRQCGEDTTYTKGKHGAILRAFFLRDLTCTATNAVRRKCCVLCGKKDFPVENGRAKSSNAADYIPVLGRRISVLRGVRWRSDPGEALAQALIQSPNFIPR